MAAILLPLLDEHEHHQRLISTLLDNDLRLKLTDDHFLSPLIPRKTRRQLISSPYIRHPSYKHRTAVASADKNNFQVNIDVQQFSPEEITVKCVNGDTIVVECKHEEKEDEHGSISRHFVRRYKVPQGHDVSKCQSKLSSDGVLTVTAPKIQKNAKTEIEIPITFTNQPSRINSSEQEAVKQNEEKKEKQ